MVKYILNDSDLLKSSNGFQSVSTKERIKLFYVHQKNSWQLLKENSLNLANQEKKVFDINGFNLTLLHNPLRIISTSANTDEISIRNRPCFLCTSTLPKEQCGLLMKENYLLLCNPYPIFEEHFTMPLLSHTPQLIYERFNDMLEFSNELTDEYLLFYNGPKCGASAPDHFHFQVCRQNDLPIINYINSGVSNPAKKIFFRENISVTFFLNGLNNFIHLASDDKYCLVAEWNVLYEKLLLFFPGESEPLINVLSFHKDKKYNLIIIPREKHRPDYFFRNDELKIVVSPASIDLSGVMIIPRKEDFEKINKELAIDILGQVTFSVEKLLSLSRAIVS